MAQVTFTGKEKIGRVTIERFRDSLRLRWTLQRKTYSLTIGKDSRDALKVARAKAQTIDSDITLEKFDQTLQKYGKYYPTVLGLVSVIQDSERMPIRELWDKYLSYKTNRIKQSTLDFHYEIFRQAEKLNEDLNYDALAVKAKLEQITTQDQTRRVLTYLSACCDWGVKHKLIANNPFAGMATDMPKPKYVTDPNPIAFTEEERAAVIEAFKSDSRKGINYRHYASFIEFLFLTGCRPSEAIGLTWNKVSSDCGLITFSESIVISKGRQIKSQGSKNNKIRTIAVSPKLQQLLQSIKTDSCKDSSLIFPSPEGRAINYDNFARRAWSTVVDPIKPNTTPYNCRDTFINLAIV